VRALNDVLRFALELCALAALAVWGFETTDGAAQWLLGLGAPLVFAVVWGVYMSPKAVRPIVGDPSRVLAELLLFGLAVAALAAAGHGALAVAFGVLVAVHLAATFPLGQRRPDA
jgi:Protein of unknown function (DUF2568)